MDAKTQLLTAIAGKNRGQQVSDGDRVAILAAVEALEDQNPCPHPLQSPGLLGGNWRLLYTTSRSFWGLDRLPGIELGQIYQYLDLNTNQVFNLAEVNETTWWAGVIVVVARCQGEGDRRVNIRFERSMVGLQKLWNYRSPREFIQQIQEGGRFFPLDFSLPSRNGTAWLDITYLDENLRISRGNEGNIFILTRQGA